MRRSKKPKALVLDDERPMETLFTLFMAMLDWECEVVSSAEEALSRLKQARFDVIITDYHLSAGDGLQFLCSARRNAIGIPAIVMSGDAKALHFVPKELLDVRAVLLKPFTGTQLNDALELALVP